MRSSSSRFRADFVDVGTGDATIIDMGDREVVIDGGNSVRILHDYVQRTQLIDGPIELVAAKAPATVFDAYNIMPDYATHWDAKRQGGVRPS